MASDLFADSGQHPAAGPLTVFRADLISSEQTSWDELFAGFTTLQAITFSSSLEMLLRLAERLDDMEIVFGSERILTREHLALAQASQTIQSYGFADALADQKALVEALGTVAWARGHAIAQTRRGRLAALPIAARPSQPREAVSAVRSGRTPGSDRLRQSQSRRLRGPSAGDLCRLRR